MTHAPAIDAMLQRRERLLGPNVPTFYDEPVHLVKGEGVWLWDKDGRKYLDCYNNVPHVGHCHPRVVEAIARQAATLNTHTRYLHDGVLDYIERLTSTMDAPLSSMVMTCTGSEANDLALRVAQAATGKIGVIATDHTYHGNTLAVSQLSTTSPPLGGAKSNVQFVPAPDSYRPLGDEAGSAHAQLFARKVEAAIAALEEQGHGFSALLLCPYFANEGFPDLTENWLKPTIDAVRKAGGLVIADEVQPGFGRLGTHMWGYQRMGFVPDIVTIGKPMANGFPAGGMITSHEMMKAFRGRTRYFNTFGGNPVACAAALAVLDVLEDEKLLQNAANLGAFTKAGMQALAMKHEVIGDVRGLGLFMGAEFVLDRKTKSPAKAYTKRVVNEVKKRGALLNFIGIHSNTLKIRPPMVFAEDNAQQFLDILDDVLSTVPVHA